jgi:hypothetical protein
MMPSAPINDRYDTCHSRWLATSLTQARIRRFNSQPVAPPIVLHERRAARSHQSAQHCFAAKPSAATAVACLLSSNPQAKDAMRRTKGRLSLLHSPSSHRDVRRPANGSRNH